MDGAFNLPDPTDWLDTPLKDFSTLENALHCQICKEFYDTPMITSCSHTFCSKCIRTCLSTDGKCPACRAADQASKLRNNWALQEVVATFSAARPVALEVAKKEQKAAAQSKRPDKRKRTVLDSDDVAQTEQDGRTTRSKSRRITASQTSQPETIEIGDSDGDGDFEPEDVADDGLVACPLGCARRMKIEQVEPHLDNCEDERRKARTAKSQTPVNTFGSSRPVSSSTQNNRAQERISELNYSLLNETKLSRKLRELGLPAWGSKQLMIKRHTEWVNLWNANCDSNRPRTKRLLLQDLDAWERTQGGKAHSSTNGLVHSVMRKDFDGVGWANRNKDDFSRLITEARTRKHSPAVEQDRAVDEDVDENAEALIPARHVDAGAKSPFQAETSSFSPRTPPEDIRPYENNPDAISSIREKVEAANAGKHIEPEMNAGFSVTVTSPSGAAVPNGLSDLPALHGTENPALLEKNHFGLLSGDNSVDATMTNTTDPPSDLPAHLRSPAPVTKKLPMFAVPEQPFHDFDAGEVGGTVEQQCS